MMAETAERQHWMAVLARAAVGELRAHLAGLPPLPPHTRLRGPEPGLAEMELLRRSRLSVVPVTAAEFALILKLGKSKLPMKALGF